MILLNNGKNATVLLRGLCDALNVIKYFTIFSGKNLDINFRAIHKTNAHLSLQLIMIVPVQVICNSTTKSTN